MNFYTKKYHLCSAEGAAAQDINHNPAAKLKPHLIASPEVTETTAYKGSKEETGPPNQLKPENVWSAITICSSEETCFRCYSVLFEIDL